MTIGEAKIDVCMTAVDIIKDTLREFGAVCGNCVSFHRYITDDKNHMGICRPDCHEVQCFDFCQAFRFRDSESCEELYQKIVRDVKSNEHDLSAE